ncbi:MAG TPA: acetolactate synthase large subunit, partial [Lysobacter sp.]
MNGAQSLVSSLIAGGVGTCFANPGTSEMHFVAALDQIDGIRCVLGLQENVVTGMADGYWRMAREPACTLLHCGPGLANGMANLHNARRAHSGILNIVGDQATHHRPFDAPLTSDTEGIARAASQWVRTSMTSAAVAVDGMAALQAALAGQVATLILPSDASWNEGGRVAAPLPALVPVAPSPQDVENAARVLRTGGDKVLLLLGGDAVLGEGQAMAWRICAQTGARVMAEYGVSRVARGQGRLPLERMPYSIEGATKALAHYDQIILVGATTPVAFFAYPGKPSLLHAPHAQVRTLVRPDQDATSGLRAL